jgi:hypothetical protein
MVSNRESESKSCLERIKQLADELACLESACDNGLMEGRREGTRIGHPEGKAVGSIHLCQDILKLVRTPEEQLYTFTVEQLQERAQALEETVVEHWQRQSQQSLQ